MKRCTSRRNIASSECRNPTTFFIQNIRLRPGVIRVSLVCWDVITDCDPKGSLSTYRLSSRSVRQFDHPTEVELNPSCLSLQESWLALYSASFGLGLRGYSYL